VKREEGAKQRKKNGKEKPDSETAFEFWQNTIGKQDEFNLLMFNCIKILEDEEEHIIFKDGALGNHKSV
jgi:hypothetical protein